MGSQRAAWDFPRPVEGVRILVEVGIGHGLDVEACLAGSDLLPDDLLDDDLKVASASEIQVIRNLLGRLGPDLPLALEAGSRYQATSFGIWGFVVLSSQTARQAAEVGVKFAALTSAYCSPRIVDRDNEALMLASLDGLPEDVSQFLLERDAAILIGIQRSILPLPMPITRMHCSFPAPSYAQTLNQYFHADIQFDQAENCIGVPAALGHFALPRRDNRFFRLCEAECEKLLTQSDGLVGMAAQVQKEILRRIQGGATMEAVSDALGVSTRTLRRHLLKENETFDGLLAKTRMSLARELLSATDMPVAHIAERLGYSLPSNFVRAFKRQEGVTPLRYRARGSAT